MLGWGMPSFLRPSKIKKAYQKVARVTNRITRPVRNIVRPLYRPVDNLLKKIPVVRSIYRGAIAQTYLATGQVHKVWGATKRTGTDIMKDMGGLKNIVKKIAKPILLPLARKGMSKSIAKVTAIPSITALVGVKMPPALPIVPVAVNELINSIWSKLGGVAKRVGIRSGKRLMNRFTRNIAGRGPSSQKMTMVPSISNKPRVSFPKSIFPKRRSFVPSKFLPKTSAYRSRGEVITPVQPADSGTGKAALVALPVLALMFMAG
jgi:hypothetical protein